MNCWLLHHCVAQLDDFEEITMMDSNDESSKADLGTRNELEPRNNASTSTESERISSKQSPQVTYCDTHLDSGGSLIIDE